MCGIFCMLSNICEDSSVLLNFFNNVKKTISNRGPDSLHTNYYNSDQCSLLFAASVLWLQGNTLTAQPIENDQSLFVYNGDVFGGENIVDEERLQNGDTMLFLKQLENAVQISTVLANVQGPYAFVYLNKTQSKLYFGRDIFGRRSLLIGRHTNGIVLTSVAQRTVNCRFLELPSIGTFCLDIKTAELSIIPWQYRNQNFQTKLDELIDFLGQQINIEQQLSFKANRMFVEPNADDLKLFGNFNISCENVFEVLLNNPEWLKKVLKLRTLLESAIRRRISTQPKFCKNCIESKRFCEHATTGVLFSGGIDCALLALLSDKFVDENRPIDLINVAFDKVKTFETPDRLSGLETLRELQTIRPDRTWNFVNVNVPAKELDTERQNHIADLIYPLNTILDDSLGCALWFASRGMTQNYTSPCRVLLVGMGADELFGGYTRHRVALKREAWRGLHQVLNEDWQNLSHRNLARDDRVVSDHGRQLRTPFLDEDVVAFVRNLHAWEKTYPSSDLPQGYGEKIFLRSLAYHLGLKNAAGLKKRALQFGSRIANAKENAHEVSPRLQCT